MLLIASCGVLTAQSWLERPAARRMDAQRRWSARPFANYRVTVRVEYWGTMCSQDIESAGEKLHRIVRNDCRVSWLSLMTVAQLFEISEGLEHPTPCYVATQTCSCYRTHSKRHRRNQSVAHRYVVRAEARERTAMRTETIR